MIPTLWNVESNHGVAALCGVAIRRVMDRAGIPSSRGTAAPPMEPALQEAVRETLGRIVHSADSLLSADAAFDRACLRLQEALERLKRDAGRFEGAE